MKRQRGDALISLLLYAGAAIAVGAFLWGAWHGFVTWVSAPRVEAAVKAQIAADQKIVDKANGERDSWKAQAEHARADTQQCREDVDVQTKKVDGWKGIADANAKAAQDAKAKALIDNANKQTSIAEWQRQARAKDDTARTCQQRLDAVTATLREGAKSRLPGAK